MSVERQNQIYNFFIRISWIAVVILIVGMSLHDANEYSVWSDGAIGREILTTFSVPHTDIFSFASEGKPFVVESWFYSVIVYMVYALFGFVGLHIFKAILIGLILLLIINLIYRRRWNPGVGAVMMLLFFVLFRDMLVLRAQLLGFVLFFACFYCLSEFKATRKNTYLYSLPVIMLIWANSHPSFIVGLVMFITYFITEFIKKIMRQKFSLWYGRTFKWRSLIRMAWIIAISCVVVIINPYTTSIYTYAFKSLSTFVLHAIMHWYVFERVLMFNIPVLAMTGFTLLCMLFVPIKRSDITDAILVIVLYCFGYFFKRYAFFPFLLVMILSIKYFSYMLDMILKELRFMGRGYRKEGYLLSSLFCLCVIGVVGAYLYSKNINKSLYKSITIYPDPVNATIYLKKHNLKPNVYTPFFYGGYLLYHLYPQYKNFIDSHTLYVDEQAIYDAQRLQEADIGWEWITQDLGIKTLLIPYTSGARHIIDSRSRFNEKISQSPYWRLAYWDDNNLLYENIDKIIDDKLRNELYLVVDVENLLQILTKDSLELREIKKELMRRKEQTPPSGWCNILLGILSIRDGNLEMGKEYFQIGVDITPTDKRLRLFKTMLEWHENGAKELLANKIAFYDSGTEGYLQSAFSLMVMGLYTDSLRVLNIILSKTPNNVEASILRGICYDSLGDYVTALVSFNKARRIDPDNTEVLYYMGQTYKNNQIWDQAARVLRFAIDRDKSNYRCWYSLAETYYQSGNIDDALAICKKTVHFRPHFFNAWLLGGKIFRKMGRYPEALDILSKAFILNPFSERLFLELAQTYAFLGKYDDAQESMDKITDSFFQNNPRYLLTMARLAAVHNNSDEAYNYLKKALELDKSDIKAELRRCKEFKNLLKTARFKKLM